MYEYMQQMMLMYSGYPGYGRGFGGGRRRPRRWCTRGMLGEMGSRSMMLGGGMMGGGMMGGGMMGGGYPGIGGFGGPVPPWDRVPTRLCLGGPG